MRFLLATLVVLTSSLLPQPSLGQVDEGSTKRLTLTSYEHLPLDGVVVALGHLDLLRHESQALAVAYYQPLLRVTAQSSSDRVALPRRGQLWLRRGLEASVPGAPGVAPLAAETRSGAVLDVLSATPDVIEPLTYAALLAGLHWRYEDDAAFSAEIDGLATKAFTTGPKAPAAAAEDVLEPAAAEVLMASASFAAHLLSLANEIERAERRRLAAGKAGLCAQARAGAGLFDLWRRAFESPTFPVTTFAADGSERTLNLSLEHRRWVVDRLLPRSGWQGGRTDHERLCRATEDGS